jgi:hypothetical protein
VPAEGAARGDFLVVRGAPGRQPALPSGYEAVLRAGDVELAVRPGWGTAQSATPHGVVVLCGFTIEPLHEVAKRAADALLTRAEVDEDDVAAFFGSVVGHFAATVVDGSSVRLITDHLGTISVYVEATSGVRVGGTNLSDVSRLVPVEPDQASIEEFLSTGRIVSPYTVYRSIHRLWPAMITRFQSDLAAAGPFWQPPAPSRGDVSEVAREYRDLLRSTLADLARQSPSVTVMYSGGEDSRIVAAMARQAGLDVHGAIFFDDRNREFAHARDSARLLRVPLSSRRRSPDHDAADLARQVLLNGPGLDLVHAHSRGLIHPDEDPMPVLDGWYAALLKADYVLSTRRYWRGFPVGRQRLGSSALADVPSPRCDPRSVTGGEIGDRWDDKARRLGHLPPISRREWVDQFPASDQYTYPFFAFNQRSFPGLSPFLLHPLVELVASVEPARRINRAFFKQAFGHSIGPAAFVPRTEGEVLGLGPRLDVVATVVNQAQYRVRSAVSRRYRDQSQGPWQSTAIRGGAARSALAASDPAALQVLSDLSPLARETIRAVEAGDSPLWTWVVVNRTAQLAMALSPPEEATRL